MFRKSFENPRFTSKSKWSSCRGATGPTQPPRSDTPAGSFSVQVRVRNDRIKRALRVWLERTTLPERHSQAEWQPAEDRGVPIPSRLCFNPPGCLTGICVCDFEMYTLPRCGDFSSRSSLKQRQISSTQLNLDRRPFFCFAEPEILVYCGT